tara:strand:- start:403 stop:585 length:183 start_codon:yes stop_codon:yes gene_type:complete
MSRPEPLMHHVDYKEYSSLVLRDIKVRWQIHQFEVKKLQEDLSLVMNAITDKAFYMVTDQ